MNKCFNPSLRAARFALRSNPDFAPGTLDCFGAKRRFAMTFEAAILGLSQSTFQSCRIIPLIPAKAGIQRTC
jgi:hypothetical protein